MLPPSGGKRGDAQARGLARLRAASLGRPRVVVLSGAAVLLISWLASVVPDERRVLPFAGRAPLGSASTLPGGAALSPVPDRMGAAREPGAQVAQAREQARSQEMDSPPNSCDSLPMAREGRVLGRLHILDGSTGKPVSAANVELGFCAVGQEVESLVQRQSDATGLVVLDYAPGELRVVAWKGARVADPLFLELQLGVPLDGVLELAPAHRVLGSVIDARSGQLIEGAGIAFRTFSECDVVYSDKEGSFVHPRFPASEYAEQVHVSAAGYGTSVAYLSVEADGRWELAARRDDLRPQIGGPDTPMKLTLVPEVQLLGTLLRADGTPISGARVVAEGFFYALSDVAIRDRRETETDAAGRFDLSGLRSDISHALVLSAGGFAERRIEIPIATGAHRLGILTLGTEALLSGLVLDADGFPAADIQVDLALADDSMPTLVLQPTAAGSGIDAELRVHGRLRSTRTDAHGVFLFERTSLGACRLSLSRGENLLLERELLAEDWGMDEIVTLAIPASFSTLHGRIVGAPRGTEVQLERGEIVARVLVDADGDFRAAGLDSGASYRLKASVQVHDEKGVVSTLVVSAEVWAFAMPVLKLQPAGLPRCHVLALDLGR